MRTVSYNAPQHFVPNYNDHGKLRCPYISPLVLIDNGGETSTFPSISV